MRSYILGKTGCLTEVLYRPLSSCTWCLVSGGAILGQLLPAMHPSGRLLSQNSLTARSAFGISHAANRPISSVQKKPPPQWHPQKLFFFFPQPTEFPWEKTGRYQSGIVSVCFSSTSPFSVSQPPPAHLSSLPNPASGTHPIFAVAAGR